MYNIKTYTHAHTHACMRVYTHAQTHTHTHTRAEANSLICTIMHIHLHTVLALMWSFIHINIREVTYVEQAAILVDENITTSTIMTLMIIIKKYNNLLTAQRTDSNTYALVARHKHVQITCNTWGACHVQHVCHTAQNNSSAIKVDRAEIAFIQCNQSNFLLPKEAAAKDGEQSQP